MNRQERRNQAKKLRVVGNLTKEEAQKIVDTYYSHKPLEEGTKVKLNWELISRSPDWKKQRKAYREWITEHKDNVFTVEWDSRRKERDTYDKKFMVCLKEDDTEPKWLFYTSLLIPQATVTVKMNSGEEFNLTMDADNIDNKLDRAKKVTKETIDNKIDEAVREAIERENSRK